MILYKLLIFSKSRNQCTSGYILRPPVYIESFKKNIEQRVHCRPRVFFPFRTNIRFKCKGFFENLNRFPTHKLVLAMQLYLQRELVLIFELKICQRV